jgi:hypothetical protein
MSGRLLLPYKRQLVRALGRGPLDDAQIDAVGRRELGARWGGVHAADELAPAALRRESYHVVNTGAARNGGVHWVALYVSRAGTVHVYDSFARPVRHLLWRPAQVVAGARLGALLPANGVADQRGASAVCGQLSLAWLLLVRDRGIRGAIEPPKRR